MTPFQAAILALVQAVTEFLPVSSSGHLILLPRLLGWSDQGLEFDIATNSVILQVVGDEDKIDGLVKMCEPYGIRELTRTGRVAMVRGTKTTTVHEQEPERIRQFHASQGRRVEGELPFSSD